MCMFIHMYMDRFFKNERTCSVFFWECEFRKQFPKLESQAHNAPRLFSTFESCVVFSPISCRTHRHTLHTRVKAIVAQCELLAAITLQPDNETQQNTIQLYPQDSVPRYLQVLVLRLIWTVLRQGSADKRCIQQSKFFEHCDSWQPES